MSETISIMVFGGYDLVTLVKMRLTKKKRSVCNT